MYFDDGAQVVAPHAEAIVDAVNAIHFEATLPYLDKQLGTVKTLGAEADMAYKKLLQEILSDEDSNLDDH